MGRDAFIDHLLIGTGKRTHVAMPLCFGCARNRGIRSPRFILGVGSPKLKFGLLNNITRQLRRMSDDGLSYAVRDVFVRFNLITQFVQIIGVSGGIPISANHGIFFILTIF